MQISNQTYDVVIKKYAPAETIVSEGTAKDCFYVILDGKVEITQHRNVIRTLQAGDVFGAENYYLKRPYTTTAIAISPARVAKYRSEIIHDIFYTNPLMAEQIFTSSIRQLEQATEKIKNNEPYEIACPIRERVYQDGEVVFSENEEADAFYCLKEAQHGLRVSIKGRDIRTITRPGEIFGVSNSILHQCRNATVSSIGRSRVQIFAVENLEEDLKNYPDIAMAIINCLSNCLREARPQSVERKTAAPDANKNSGKTF